MLLQYQKTEAAVKKLRGGFFVIMEIFR